MSSTALTEFNTEVDDLIQDQRAALATGSVDRQIKIALSRYSRDRPNEDVKEFAGDGGKYYALTTALTTWEEGFSSIRMIEYPAATVASDEQPQVLEDEDWAIFKDATAKYLYFPNHAPASTETVRVWFSVPYAFSSDPLAVDIRDEDFYALCWLSASFCCDILAAYYATHVDLADGTLQAKRGKLTEKYQILAKKYLANYQDHLNLSDDLAAAGVIAEWDVKPRGREYAFHGSRTR